MFKPPPFILVIVILDVVVPFNNHINDSHLECSQSFRDQVFFDRIGSQDSIALRTSSLVIFAKAIFVNPLLNILSSNTFTALGQKLFIFCSYLFHTVD